MLSAANLDAMDLIGGEYVVGARLRTLPVALQKQVLETDAYVPLEEDRRVGEWEYKGRRLIVVFCPKRARKDAYERRHQVQRLLERLKRSDNPKELLSHHGVKRFIAVEGNARFTVNPEKIAEQWDGLAGVVTNLRDASVAEVMAHYHGLWQVEESFRITKHDLKVRPIWHWNENRIRIAMAFMACVRHLAYRVAIQKRRMSPEMIRSALVHRQCSVLPAIGQPLRHPLKADPSSRADLRNHGATPDDHPVPARLSADRHRPDSKKCQMLCLAGNENRAISTTYEIQPSKSGATPLAGQCARACAPAGLRR